MTAIGLIKVLLITGPVLVVTRIYSYFTNKLVRKFFVAQNLKEAKVDNKFFYYSDKPITDDGQDYLEINTRLVNKIHNFSTCKQLSSIVIAITGEWGSGKTSVMKLLTNKINASTPSHNNRDQKNRNIVIEFEPLLEGKLEISAMLELFYLKLHSAIGNNESTKEIFKKLLKSLGALTFTGTTVSIPTFAQLDLSKKYDKMLKIWDENNVNSFAQQTNELNQYLKKNNIKIFAFIDEIDRLSIDHIINFLMFARILETFDNLTCIIGMDYDQVVQSLKTSYGNTDTSYQQATSYLDKLFQARYNVNHNNIELMKLTEIGLKDINGNLFEPIINSENYEARSSLSNLVDFLNTPRQIKKWLIQLLSHKALIECYPKEILKFLTLAAICVKHPIILSNIAKRTIPILNNDSMIKLYLQNIGAIELSKVIDTEEKKRNELILQSTGILPNRMDENYKVLNELGIKFITDSHAYQLLTAVLPDFKSSLLIMYINGFSNEEHIKLFYNYFDGETQETINHLIKEKQLDKISNMSEIIKNIEDSLYSKQGHPNKIVDIKQLNMLWEAPKYLRNSYDWTVLFILNKHHAKEVIDKVSISLLQEFIHNILRGFNINVKKDHYNINDFKNYYIDNNEEGKYHFTETYSLRDLKINDKDIKDIEEEDIAILLKCCLDRFKHELEDNFTLIIEKENIIIPFFYRYIQWSNTIASNDTPKNQAVLINTIKNYCESSEQQPEYQAKLVNAIFKDCTNNDTIKFLFDNNEGLIKTLKRFASKHSKLIKNTKDFLLRCE